MENYQNEHTMYECIVFDLDGTLLNTLADLTDSVNFALRKNGLKTRSQEEVRSFIGNGVKNLIDRSVGAENLTMSAKVLADYREYYQAHCAEKTAEYEGTSEMLKGLKSRGITIAMLSNKQDIATQLLAERYFKGLFDVAVGERESAGIRKKPAPDGLYAVLEKLQKSKEKTLYVGDSEVDIQTAKNAGVDCLSVAWGFKDEEFLKANGATKIAYSPKEILKLV